MASASSGARSSGTQTWRARPRCSSCRNTAATSSTTPSRTTTTGMPTTTRATTRTRGGSSASWSGRVSTVGSRWADLTILSVMHRTSCRPSRTSSASRTPSSARACSTRRPVHSSTGSDMRRIHLLFISFALFMATTGCEQDDPVNPFDNQVVNQDTVKLEIIDPEPNSIAGIYQNILKPTCANSGCHDGTFEPDYRTLEGAYNTLVYQVPIKNDGNYDYRVEPYNPQRSVLMARLNNILTPAMPIQVDPGSDWPAKQAQYIENIRTWIANGA